MQYLILNMWMLLAGAAFIALLLGWSLRGLISAGRRQALSAECETFKAELADKTEALTALQASLDKRQLRSAEAVSGDDTLRQELEEREKRLNKLTSELGAAQAELEALRTEDTADTASDQSDLSEKVQAESPDADDVTALKDRNIWLEERIATVEADLLEQMSKTAAPASDASRDQAKEKLHWQASYLRQRVDALEAALLVAQAEQVTQDVAEENDPVPEADKAASDEEMARLRWRNRYLEGRLAYYEDHVAEPDEPAEQAGQAEVTSLLEARLADLPLSEEADDNEIAEETGLAAEEEPSDTENDLAEAVSGETAELENEDQAETPVEKVAPPFHQEASQIR